MPILLKAFKYLHCNSFDDDDFSNNKAPQPRTKFQLYPEVSAKCCTRLKTNMHVAFCGETSSVQSYTSLPVTSSKGYMISQTARN